MYDLSELYSRGYAVEPDARKDLELLEQAAALGSSRAQYALGCRYLAGEGVPRDEAKGLSLLNKAAAQGDAFARQKLKSLSGEEEQSEAAPAPAMA